MEPIALRPDSRYMWKNYMIVSLIAVLAMAVSILIGVLIGAEEGGPNGGLTGMLIAIGLNLLWLIPALLLIPAYYHSLNYEIQDDEVIVRAGVITKSVKHVPYRTVTNLKVKRDPFDRMLSLGTLEIQTAGMSGSEGGAEEKLVGLQDVETVYENIATTLRRFRGGVAPTQTEEETIATDGQHEVLAAILEETRTIREYLARTD